MLGTNIYPSLPIKSDVFKNNPAALRTSSALFEKLKFFVWTYKYGESEG
jgi:hypothetical protein